MIVVELVIIIISSSENDFNNELMDLKANHDKLFSVIINMIKFKPQERFTAL